MPAVLSRLALPYGIEQDYRIGLAAFSGNQRGRAFRRSVEAHPISAHDSIMPLPDYGIVVEKLRTPDGRAVRLLLHAGYFSERRFARYAYEFKDGQLTRIQAHHSFAFLAVERDCPWMYVLCRRLRTGKCNRETFCNVLDALQYRDFVSRAEV